MVRYINGEYGRPIELISIKGDGWNEMGQRFRASFDAGWIGATSFHYFIYGKDEETIPKLLEALRKTREIRPYTICINDGWGHNEETEKK